MAKDDNFFRRLIFTCVTLVIVVFVIMNFFQAQQPKQPYLVSLLSKTFDKSPAGFTFKYPETWDYVIPTHGVLIAGTPDTLFDGQPGATLTVQRSMPLSIPGSLEGALNRYLEYGPMRVEGRWQPLGEIRPLTFDGRDARMVELIGANDENTPQTHVQIIATAADNTFVYLMITTAPVDLRPLEQPLLDAVLASVHILE